MEADVTVQWVMFHEHFKAKDGSDHAQWVLQCLEHDIATQGDTPEEAIKAFEHTLLVHMQQTATYGWDPFTDLPPAPAHFWQMVA